MTSLLEQLKNSKPQFPSTEAAIDFYSKKLDAFCFKYEKSREELFLWLEYSPRMDTDMREAFSTFRLLHGLERLHEERKARMEFPREHSEGP